MRGISEDGVSRQQACATNKLCRESKRAVKPRASRLAGARGQSPRIKAQSKNAQQAIREKQTTRPVKKARQYQKYERVQNQCIRSNYVRKIIAAPEINGDSSLISRPEERGAKARNLSYTANVRLHKQSPDFWTDSIIGLISISESNRVQFGYPTYCGSQGRPLRGELSKTLRCLTAGAAIIYADGKSVDGCIVHARVFVIAAPFLGGKFAVILKFALHFGFVPW